MTTTAAVDVDRTVTDEALTWPDRARTAAVVDPASYQSAGELLKGIKQLRQKIAETFDPHIRRAHDSHRALCEEKRQAEAPLTEAERLIKNALVAYDTEQERIRREEQRRLEREAQQEQERLALERAAALEREGNAFGDAAMVTEAGQVLEEQLQAPPPPVAAVQKATPKVAGIVHRTTWSARVTDLHALVKFVAANPSYIGLLTANLPALNGQARSLKGAMRLPGVQAVPTNDVAAGR
jgi:hypothetical protein